MCLYIGTVNTLIKHINWITQFQIFEVQLFEVQLFEARQIHRLVKIVTRFESKISIYTHYGAL